MKKVLAFLLLLKILLFVFISNIYAYANDREFYLDIPEYYEQISDYEWYTDKLVINDCKVKASISVCFDFDTSGVGVLSKKSLKHFKEELQNKVGKENIIEYPAIHITNYKYKNIYSSYSADVDGVKTTIFTHTFFSETQRCTIRISVDSAVIAAFGYSKIIVANIKFNHPFFVEEEFIQENTADPKENEEIVNSKENLEEKNTNAMPFFNLLLVLFFLFLSVVFFLILHGHFCKKTFFTRKIKIEINKKTVVLLCLMHVVVFILFVFYSTALKDKENNQVEGFVCSIIILCIIISIFGVFKRNHEIAFSPLVLSATICLVYLGVIFDQPYFIRQIDGEDFLGYSFLFCTSVITVSLCIKYSFVVSICKNRALIAKTMDFSDSDLMLLQHFDRYELCGYYILKGITNNILKYRIEQIGENEISVPVIDLNTDLTENEILDYCSENPQVEKIVKKIYYYNDSIILKDLVGTVEFDLSYNSMLAQFFRKCKKYILKMTAWIDRYILYCVYYWCGTKLMMGYYNDKEVSNLIGAIVFFSISIFIYIILDRKVFVEDIFERYVKTEIISNESFSFVDLRDLVFNMDITVDEIGSEESKKILRAYAIYGQSYKEEIIKKASVNCSGAIVAAVLAAQVEFREKTASSDSGCSGCSSCSSCGGCSGCGGCGGCGD